MNNNQNLILGVIASAMLLAVQTFWSAPAYADHNPGHDTVARGGVVGLRLDLEKEISDRIAGDAALQSQVDGEAAARAAEDAQLKNDLAAETAARQAAIDAIELTPGPPGPPGADGDPGPPGSADPRVEDLVDHFCATAPALSLPEYCPRRTSIVFVTSELYGPDLDGVLGADAKCQRLAHRASLPGTYAAWLSTSTIDARDRIADAEYYRVDGELIAENLAQLTDPTVDLLVPINVTESGDGIIGSELVLTGTSDDGTLFFLSNSGLTCNDWLGDYPPDEPNRVCDSAWLTGLASYTTGRWTSSGPSFGQNPGRLYCFRL